MTTLNAPAHGRPWKREKTARVARAETHLAELVHLAPTMRALWEALEANASSSPSSLAARTSHSSSLTA